MTTAEPHRNQNRRNEIFFALTDMRIKSAASKEELATVAKAMDTPEFYALPNEMAEELAFQHSMRHFLLEGAGML